MLKIASLCLLLAAASSLWSQVEPSAMGGGFELDDEHMMTPPPVSRDAYPVIVGSEMRANYLSAGMVVTGAYVDNLMLITSKGPISDETYTFSPTVGFDRRTPRQGETLSYSSGFTVFQNTSQLNAVSQNASASYRFHLSPYAVLQFSDDFQQDYNLYNQGNPFTAGGVASGTGTSNSALIEPFANQLGNITSGGIDYQYGRNAMIGASGGYSFMKYSDLSNVPGLNNEDTADGSAFFSRRLAPSQYVGVTYQYSKFVTHPVDTYTLSDTVFGFYTHYFTRSFSISVLGGPEHYTSWSKKVPTRQAAWTPAVQGSFRWQSLHTSVAASFSHVVSGAGGLIGTYHSDLLSLGGQMQLARRWSAGVHADYALFKSLNSSTAVIAGYPGGHTISGGADVQHRISERVYAEFGYQHFHQSYGGITVSSAFQDSNREYGSISYQISRPLGR